MPIIQNVIRGGQLSLHALRMFKEIIKILIIWFCASNLLIFGAKVYFSTSQKEWRVAGDYYLASVLNKAGLAHRELNVTYLTGQKVVLNVDRIAGSQFYKNKTVELEDNIKKSSIFAGTVSFAISILAVAYFIRKGINKTEDKYKRGAKAIDAGGIKWSISNHNRRNNYDAYLIAGLQYPARAEMQHSIVIGTTGTGKTVLISDIVEQIRARGDRAIIFDTKGCYVEWFYAQEKDHILNPFDTRSEKWNLLKEIRRPEHIKSIAQSFIPEGKANSGIWNEAGRIVFTGFIEKLYQEDNITNRDIADLIMKQSPKEIIKFLKDTYAQSIVDTKAPETTGGVMFTLSAYLNNLRLMNDKKSESFSIKEWCRDASDSFLFITSNKEASAELVPLQTVWWEIVFNGLLSDERNTGRKTWIILDEVGSLQKIPSLEEAMSKTREYGCCFVLGMQDIGQLEEIYGARQSRTISTLCNTRCIFRTPDPYTSSWLSKNIGDQELEQVKEGLSYGAHQMRDGVSVNKQNVIRPLVLPSEIQNLRDLELYLQLPNYPFVKTKIDWKERKVKSKGFVENSPLPVDAQVSGTVGQIDKTDSHIEVDVEEEKIKLEKKLEVSEPKQTEDEKQYNF